jgi:hypothetical protein
MPSIEEIRIALGKMDESSEEPSSELSNINENVNPFSEKFFAPIEQLQREIQDKDKIIESLKNESTELKNQVSITEEEKSTILKELEKSRWFESKVALATKKVYEDKVKSIINVNVDSKLIPVLTTVARRKQGKQQLNWGNWLKIPENRYLFQVNEDIARKVFEDTNALIPRKRTRGGGEPTKFVSNYSLTFDRSNESHVTTEFDPVDYNLNHGFTVSFWVRPDELGSHRFAIGRRMASAKGRFTFGVRSNTNAFVGVGNSKKQGDAHGMEVGTWYHWAITYAGNNTSPKTLKLYIDGEEIIDSTTSWPDADLQTGIPIYFGARNVWTMEYNAGWSCGLDEVAIFDEVKSIGTLYTGAKPSDLSGVDGLVGYWRFEKGSGTTVEDLSGNGNDGTFAPISGDTTALPTWSGETP